MNERLRDPHSPLGTYQRINPCLQSCDIYKKPLINERDRSYITKYRTGSHKLRIHTGRINKEAQHERLCICQNDIQTLGHVIFDCTNTENLRRLHHLQVNDLKSFFEMDCRFVALYLRDVEHIMKLS